MDRPRSRPRSLCLSTVLKIKHQSVPCHTASGYRLHLKIQNGMCKALDNRGGGGAGILTIYAQKREYSRSNINICRARLNVPYS